MLNRFVLTFVVLAGISSCQLMSNLRHDDEMAARLGTHRLYRSELERFIPEGISSEDSTALARQYINSWASEVIFMDVASRQLSKSEMDVSEELEDYRRSLLRYRYEQRYINERLDTLVSDSQIQEYYESHTDLFTLKRPIVKARFLDIMKETPSRETIVRKMKSSDYQDLVDADSLAFSSALKYFDNSDRWMDSADLAKEFSLDYSVMLSMMKDNLITLQEEGRGDVKYAYVCNIQRSGKAPVEYCRERIRDIILSNRKHELVMTLEQDLLEDALDNNKLEIF